MKKPFDHRHYAWTKDINYRQHPERYLVGKGEQGVLICEPYKSEILPYWQFKTEVLAKQSAKTIYGLFKAYLKAHDFVGADMARKFLQMGFTRARRYANFKGGKKYKADGALYTKGSGDPEKVLSANIFYAVWQKAENNPTYRTLKAAWKQKEKKIG